jgi:competence protein ComEA
VSRRHAQHLRPGPSEDSAARLLARLRPAQVEPLPRAAPGDDQVPEVGGWVPQRPATGSTAAASSRPPAGLPVLWLPARRAVVGLGLVLLIAVLVALFLVWQAQPSAEAAPRVHRSAPTVGATDAPAGVVGTPAPAAAPAVVVVHVVGAVHRPGLVRLPVGSRVADAVKAAGGTTASARPASINLARVLVDGEQLVVQRRSGPPLLAAPGAMGGGTAGAAGAGAGPVDLNTATLEALDGLPGIGPVLAQRILDWRTAHGRFSSVDELGEVSGIGEATLDDLRPVVTV